MQFTYDSYVSLLHMLSETGYLIKGYHEQEYSEPCAILRHDIDYSIEKALVVAEIEQKEGVSSTYFVLVSSDLYNPLSRKYRDEIRHIISMGHEIGLHFDEGAYSDRCNDNIIGLIKKESAILSEIANQEIRVVSMHRPSKKTLESYYEIPGMVNSYGRKFFDDFKYLSDSRMRWREPIEEIVAGRIFERLHILTHCFWYGNKVESMRIRILNFLSEANKDRYDSMNDNFTNLQNVVERGEIE